MGTSNRLSFLQDGSPMARITAIGAGAATATSGALGQPIRFDGPLHYSDTGGTGNVLTGDFDRDAHTDVVVTGGGAINIYFNDGAGGLLPETAIPYLSLWYLAAADMDEDADIDIVWIDRREDQTYVVSIWYNAGDGRSGEVVQTALSNFKRIPVQIWDVDSDDRNDVLFSAGPASVDVMLNKGNRIFTEARLFEYDLPEYTLSAMVAGDFDGDGDADIAATFQYIYYVYYKEVKGTNVSLLMNDRAIPFRLGPELILPWATNSVLAWSMSTGDLDGDGDLDVVTAGSPTRESGPDEFAVLENTGGAFSLATMYRASEGWPEETALVDIDTDGRLDLVFATGVVKGIYVVRNLGGFQFSGMAPFPSRISGSTMSVADVDGDGQFDLLHGGRQGFAVLTNRTPLDGPRLEVSRLVRGQNATFAVHNARAGERVHLLYSVEGIGRTRGQAPLGGMTLDLRPQVLELATIRADQTGSAVFRTRIPADAPLGPAAFQAVIRRGRGGFGSVKSPFRTVLVEE